MMNIDVKLLVQIILGLLLVTVTAGWLSHSVKAIQDDAPYVHAKCCATHGGCKDPEKCATGGACCSNDDCGECCGAQKDGIPVCRARTDSTHAHATASLPHSTTATASADSAALRQQISALKLKLVQLEQQLATSHPDSLHP